MLHTSKLDKNMKPFHLFFCQNEEKEIMNLKALNKWVVLRQSIYVKHLNPIFGIRRNSIMQCYKPEQVNIL